jgi:bifunctional DNA-binding transcriptional regulator/antitoxin component of YhaV-PrlF toxin-antitoxin module
MAEPGRFVIPKSIRRANYDSEGRVTSSFEVDDAMEILREVQPSWPTDFREAFLEARTKLDEVRAREAKLSRLVEEQAALLESLNAVLEQRGKIIKELMSAVGSSQNGYQEKAPLGYLELGLDLTFFGRQVRNDLEGACPTGNDGAVEVVRHIVFPCSVGRRYGAGF